MRNINTGKHQATRGMLHIGGVAALVMACTVALPQSAHAERVERPFVPDKLEVLGDNKVVRVGHAVGTQNYVCLPSGATFVWNLFTPEATLFTEAGRQIITHFFSPNPDGIVRAAWQDSKDASTFWGQATVLADSTTDPTFVKQGAIPWVLLQFSGSQDGPTGGHRLTGTTFVQRVNTDGGSAPSTGCAQSTDVGRKAFIPYTADYFFYESTNGQGRDAE